MEIATILEQFMMPIIVMACYAAGAALKSTKLIPDKFIPIIMFAIGGILAPLVTHELSVQTVLMGCISGWASTGLNQTIKQLGKEE